ncbi:hypothetical protein HK101_009547, partial [Irineochytrium annulatum]
MNHPMMPTSPPEGPFPPTTGPQLPTNVLGALSGSHYRVSQITATGSFSTVFEAVCIRPPPYTAVITTTSTTPQDDLLVRTASDASSLRSPTSELRRGFALASSSASAGCPSLASPPSSRSSSTTTAAASSLISTSPFAHPPPYPVAAPPTPSSPTCSDASTWFPSDDNMLSQSPARSLNKLAFHQHQQRHQSTPASWVRAGDLVALKCMVKAADAAGRRAQMQEAELLMRLRHEDEDVVGPEDESVETGIRRRRRRSWGVVALYEVIETDEFIILVLEHCETDLYNLISESGQLNYYTVMGLFPRIANALDFCHSRGIYHRDLKPENILVNTADMSVRLADFGLATDNAWSTRLACGSVRYMSPECMGFQADFTADNINSQQQGYFCAPSDTWSLGIVLLNLIVARHPWPSPLAPLCIEHYLRNREPVLRAMFGITEKLDA